MTSRYQHLRADLILATIDKLQARIAARFPEAGLLGVCAALEETARFCAQDAAELARQSFHWRAAALVLVALGVAAQIAAFRLLRAGDGMSAADLVQGLEAAVNLLILFAGAVWFTLTLGERFKRRRALDALHRLRSLAHVVDMHQLTKDPTLLLEANKTAVSPQRSMSAFELTRYLDYCSEMLALIGKLAALYAERMRDNVVIEAVNDIENLTTGLGRKIWQKITIIGALEERRA
jgi:hypothetical protein